MPVGVVNWSVTQPARDVRGYLVSDQFERRYATVVDVENIGVISPRTPRRWPWRPPAKPAAPNRCRRPGRRMMPASPSRIPAPPTVSTNRLPPSSIGACPAASRPSATNAWTRPATTSCGTPVPRAFGDVSDAELQRYGGVLIAHYAAADQMLGRVMAGLRPGDLLLVVSGFGMEPMSIGKRLLERTVGNPEPSGTHEPAPDGFLFAYRHRRQARADCRAGRSWTSCRRSSTSSACRSAGTWTASPARTSSRRPSARAGPSRTFRRYE